VKHSNLKVIYARCAHLYVYKPTSRINKWQIHMHNTCLVFIRYLSNLQWMGKKKKKITNELCTWKVHAYSERRGTRNVYGMNTHIDLQIFGCKLVESFWYSTKMLEHIKFFNLLPCKNMQTLRYMRHYIYNKEIRNCHLIRIFQYVTII
jgi:hypothetical protein